MKCLRTMRFSLTENGSRNGTQRIVKQVRQKGKNVGQPQILAPGGIQQKTGDFG